MKNSIVKHHDFEAEIIKVEPMPEANMVRLKPEEYRTMAANKTGWLILMASLGAAGLIAAIGLVAIGTRPAPVVNPTCVENCSYNKGWF
ncbi:hypothetical protein C7B61_00365 [filamentous cyanobacterium CCP1]|nr:hypothetical protein C7B76_16700 [filamentous cyanobacterium CCP2]PSB68550.1 hypothetical protein C7B61_00365 [filamentous cyanobacterium CCP1]